MKKLESNSMGDAETLEIVKKNISSVETIVRSIRGLAFYAFAGVAKDSPASRDLEALVSQTTCLLVYLEAGGVYLERETKPPVELIEGKVRPAAQH